MTADEVAKDIVDAAIKRVRGFWNQPIRLAWRTNYENANTVLNAQWLCPCSLKGWSIRISIRYKTVEKILPIHVVELLSYLKLSGLSLGLMFSWNVILLRDGNPASPKHLEELKSGRE